MRWAARRPKVWLALAAPAAATWLASRDARTGWTVVVGVVTTSLAAAVLRDAWVDAHPNREAEKAAKFQEQVDAILWRHEHTKKRSEDGT